MVFLLFILQVVWAWEEEEPLWVEHTLAQVTLATVRPPYKLHPGFPRVPFKGILEHFLVLFWIFPGIFLVFF